MTKAELRAHGLAKRRALPTHVVTERSERLADHFFTTCWPGAAPTSQHVVDATTLPVQTLHAFLPIRRQNEVDTWPIIHRIWRAFPNLNVVAPVTDVATRQMTHYPLTPTTLLRENRWGIPEPITAAEAVPPAQLDVVLVPLLAFDRRGHRVGYGGGYYDRFLAQCRPDCRKIGLSLFGPVDQIDDVVASDIRLDACVTPAGVCTFL